MQLKDPPPALMKKEEKESEDDFVLIKNKASFLNQIYWK